MTRFEPRSWLLGTGEVVSEPALEMTASGRKVRLAGTTHSVYQNDTEELLFDAVKRLAGQKQTHVLIELTKSPRERTASAVGYDPATTPARLHFIHAATDRSAKTITWWRFKDTKSPFEVLLTAMMWGNSSTNASQMIRVVLSMPVRTYYNGTSDDSTCNNVLDERFSTIVTQVGHLSHDHEYSWHEFIRDNPPNWPSSLLGDRTENNYRTGAEAYLKIIRELDGLDSIQVPDLGDTENPSWKTLDLYDTNYNEALASDLAEYLDGAPTVEQAAELYKQMLETLRGCGIVTNPASTNDFMAALLGGDKAVLGVRVHNLADSEHRTDDNHKLSLHLPTGTFIVECNHKEVDRNEVAEKWEEALTMASLTGQENELLAYAKAYARDHAQTRTKQILKERT